MGLKQDLIDAKIKSVEDIGGEPVDSSNGSVIEREAEYTKEAIVNFLTSVEFRITQLNAPVILEDFKIPPQSGDIQPSVVSVDTPYPGGVAATTIDIPLKNTNDGVLTTIDVNKNGGAIQTDGNTGILTSTGYVFIGIDPISQDGFDVEDLDGQREFTTVKLFREDIEDLL
mgnify:CR=1 FL=1